MSGFKIPRIQHCQYIFLLYSILHIQDALHSLLPDSADDTTDFNTLISGISNKIEVDLRKENYDGQPPGMSQKAEVLSNRSAQAKVLARDHLQKNGNLVRFFERSGMWRNQANAIYWATEDAANDEDTARQVNGGDSPLRLWFLAASENVATSRFEYNLIRVACGIRWGWKGENMMRGKRDRRTEMDKHEALALDLAASIDINCLVTQLSEGNEIKIGELLEVRTYFN